jgi:hypothetical protein
VTQRLIVAVILAGLATACGGGSGSAPATGDRSTPAANAPAQEEETPAPPPAPVQREVTIPAGTVLRLDLTTPLDSETSKVEDTVRATLRDVVKVGRDTVLPVGTQVSGAVTEAKGSGRVKGRARLAFRFTSLHLGKERYTIQTAPIAREAEATKKEDAKKIGIGAGIGAAIGAIAGGGSGAAKGAAIGGAGGTGVLLATKGKEVRLAAGAHLSTKLAGPVSVDID